MREARIALETRLLHVFARVVVRVQPPLQAKRTVFGVGRLLPRLSLSEAEETVRRLEGRGTCLTRALTVAACLPGSDVVIGSDGVAEKFAAHAWVECNGDVINGMERSRHDIARL
ncbi:MAG TPA: lasso peptide biosynthesis B2 protein [Polyangiaceae bacterium]|jgi:hypothetical protein